MGKLSIPGKPVSSTVPDHKKLPERTRYIDKLEDLLGDEAIETNEDRVNDLEVDDDDDSQDMECENIDSSIAGSLSEPGSISDSENAGPDSNNKDDNGISDEDGDGASSAGGSASSPVGSVESRDVLDLSTECASADKRNDPDYYKYYDEGRMLRKCKKDLVTEMTAVSGEIQDLACAVEQTVGWVTVKRLEAGATAGDQVCEKKAKAMPEYCKIDESIVKYNKKYEENRESHARVVKEYDQLIEAKKDVVDGAKRAELDRKIEAARARMAKRGKYSEAVVEHVKAAKTKRDKMKSKVRGYNLVKMIRSFADSIAESTALTELAGMKERYEELIAEVAASTMSRTKRKRQYENLGAARRRIRIAKKVVERLGVYRNGVRDWEEFQDNYQVLANAIASINSKLLE